MVNFEKSALGTVTQSRTALAVVAATFLVGGSITEASARSRTTITTITTTPRASRAKARRRLLA